MQLERKKKSIGVLCVIPDFSIKFIYLYLLLKGKEIKKKKNYTKLLVLIEFKFVKI